MFKNLCINFFLKMLKNFKLHIKFFLTISHLDAIIARVELVDVTLTTDTSRANEETARTGSDEIKTILTT